MKNKTVAIEEFDIFDGVDTSKLDEKDLDYINKVSDIIVKLVNKRISLGMSQRELAKLSGIKQPMIARIETLESMPRIDTLVRLCGALYLNVDLNDCESIGDPVDLNIKSFDYNINEYDGNEKWISFPKTNLLNCLN